MKIFFIICLILIGVKCLTDILSSKINKTYVVLNAKLFQKNKMLIKTISLIKRELSLLKLKDCPAEEKINIPLEVLDMINDLEQYWCDN